MVKRRQKSKKVTKENPNSLVEKQFFWLVGMVIFIILGFVFIPILYHQIFEKFEYGGIKFEKIKEGKLTFYHGQFPVIYKGTFYAVYNIYLRNDPRTNQIPIQTNFGLSNNISISLNDGAASCTDAMLGQMELGKFFSAFPFINKNITTGFYNATLAKEYNLESITCKNASKDKTIIVIQKSETPSIEAGDADNCYVLNIGECKYLETVERYIIGAMAEINGKPLE